MAEPGGDKGAEIGRRHDAAPRTGVMNEFLEPGDLVTHPGRPDWGLGQVQSVIGGRITVNFEHAGKVVIEGSRIELQAERRRPARRD